MRVSAESVLAFAGALKQLSPEMIRQLVVSGQLSDGQVKAALTTNILTEKEKEAIRTKLADAGATTGAAGATKLFDFSLKGLLATMKALAVAHPVLTILAAIAALAGGIAIAVDAATTSIDEHNERIAELESEGRELQSELDSLNQELDTFADRLDELRNKKVAGTLNLVEKSELEDLERRNQLLLQYKELIQDDVDKNTREKLDEANEVFQSRYHASSISVSSAGVAVEGALQSREAEETLLYYTAETKRISELMADARSQLAQGGLSENDTRILEQNIRVYQKWIDGAKADVQDIVDDLSPSVKSVIDTGVTSGAEYDKAKAILDAIAQWQLVDATVSEKIAYLAKSAPQILQQIVAKTDGVLTEAKVAASESLQDFVNLAIQLGVIPDNSAESLAALTAAIADVGKTAASSGVEVKTFEGIVSSLSEGMGAITAAQEDMAETGYLSADSVKALKSAGLDNYLVACEKGYKLTSGALDTYLNLQQAEYENAFGKAKNAALALIDNEEAKTRAINGTTDALVKQLRLQQADIQTQIQQTTKTIGYIGINPSMSLLTPDQKQTTKALQSEWDAIEKAINDVLTSEKNLDEFERARATAKRDYTGKNKTDANKSEFEEEYAKQKHALELGKKTLKEFNDWLDGNDGYKKYFADRKTYAEEWRKYEKEVFDNSMQLHEQEATNLDHTIEMLKLQNASEQDILAVYRKKQTLLKNTRDLVYDFLKAQGLSEEQIASNSTIQELDKALLENPNEATDFYKERVDQNVADFEHVIDMLERTEGREGELIAKYREEQAYLVGVREEYRKTLVAAGKTAEEIAKDDWFQELTNQILDVNDAISDTLETLFDTASGHVNDLFDLTEELVRHEAEEMIDALGEQKDAFSEIIDAKKEMLQLAKREQEYNDKVAESTKDIAKLQSRIDALSMDDSRQAKMERAKLEEELAELQKSLADTQTDHYIEVTEDALDKEEKDYHDLMDTKIKELEDFLDDNEAVAKETLKRLDNMNEELFDDLLGYAKHYTDTTGEDLVTMWNNAKAAAEKYGSYTNSMKIFSDGDTPTNAQSIMKKMFDNQNAWASTSDPEARARYDQANVQLGQQLASELGVNVWRQNGIWYIGDGDLLFSDFVGGNSTAKVLVKQMKDNGDAWGRATTDAERQVYERANEEIGKQLQQLLGVPVWRKNGRWYIGDGEELYKVYGFHTGGAVGRTGSVSPKADELFALLQDNEVVMSRRMVNNTLDFLTGLPKVMASTFQAPLSWAAQAVSGAREYVLNISAPLNMDGVLPQEEILSVIKQYPRKVAEVVSSQLRKL